MEGCTNNRRGVNGPSPYRILLVTIGNDLKNEDLQKLIFFCKDKLATSSLDECSTPSDLLLKLHDAGVIKERDLLFLKYLLTRIEMYSLVTMVTEYELTHASIPFRELLLEINNNLSSKDFYNLVNLTEISPSEREIIATPLDLFNKLENLELISENPLNLSWLMDALEKLKKGKLVNLIKKYKQPDIQNRVQSVPTLRQKNTTIGSKTIKSPNHIPTIEKVVAFPAIIQSDTNSGPATGIAIACTDVTAPASKHIVLSTGASIQHSPNVIKHPASPPDVSAGIQQRSTRNLQADQSQTPMSVSKAKLPHFSLLRSSSSRLSTLATLESELTGCKQQSLHSLDGQFLLSMPLHGPQSCPTESNKIHTDSSDSIICSNSTESVKLETGDQNSLTSSGEPSAVKCQRNNIQPHIIAIRPRDSKSDMFSLILNHLMKTTEALTNSTTISPQHGIPRGTLKFHKWIIEKRTQTEKEHNSDDTYNCQTLLIYNRALMDYKDVRGEDVLPMLERHFQTQFRAERPSDTRKKVYQLYDEQYPELLLAAQDESRTDNDKLQCLTKLLAQLFTTCPTSKGVLLTRTKFCADVLVTFIRGQSQLSGVVKCEKSVRQIQDEITSDIKDEDLKFPLFKEGEEGTVNLLVSHEVMNTSKCNFAISYNYELGSEMFHGHTRGIDTEYYSLAETD